MAERSASDEVTDEETAAAVPADGQVVTPPTKASERRNLKRKGYELDFNAEALQPSSSSQESLSSLAEQRARLNAEKKMLTGNIKRAKKAEARLKKKAMSLSSKDLCEIIGMKTTLAKQWQEKKEKEEKKKRDAAAQLAREQNEE